MWNWTEEMGGCPWFQYGRILEAANWGDLKSGKKFGKTVKTIVGKNVPWEYMFSIAGKCAAEIMGARLQLTEWENQVRKPIRMLGKSKHCRQTERENWVGKPICMLEKNQGIVAQLSGKTERENWVRKLSAKTGRENWARKLSAKTERENKVGRNGRISVI